MKIIKEISKESFVQKFYSMSNEKLAEELGVSRSTIQVEAKKLGLYKGCGYNTRKIRIK